MSIASPEATSPANVKETSRWKKPVTHGDLEFFAETIFPWLQQRSEGTLGREDKQEIGAIWIRISAAVVARGRNSNRDEMLPTVLQDDATRALIIFDSLEPETDEGPDPAPIQRIGAATRAPLGSLMQRG